VAAIFTAYDKNGDGLLDKDEVAAMVAAGEARPPTELQPRAAAHNSRISASSAHNPLGAGPAATSSAASGRGALDNYLRTLSGGQPERARRLATEQMGVPAATSSRPAVAITSSKPAGPTLTELAAAAKWPESRYAVRPRPGRLRALSVFHSRSILYGPFVWTRRALNGRKWRLPARAVADPTRTALFLWLAAAQPAAVAGRVDPLFSASVAAVPRGAGAHRVHNAPRNRPAVATGPNRTFGSLFRTVHPTPRVQETRDPNLPCRGDPPTRQR
jgi:hypothetical protein